MHRPWERFAAQDDSSRILTRQIRGATYLAGWASVCCAQRGRDGWPSNRLPPLRRCAEAAIPQPFRTRVIISLMNPKAILFFLSFFIQFVDSSYPHPGLSFLILGAIVQICSAAYLTALIFGGAFLAAQFRQRRRTSAVATGLVGSLFIAFSAKLASATLR